MRQTIGRWAKPGRGTNIRSVLRSGEVIAYRRAGKLRSLWERVMLAIGMRRAVSIYEVP